MQPRLRSLAVLLFLLLLAGQAPSGTPGPADRPIVLAKAPKAAREGGDKDFNRRKLAVRNATGRRLKVWVQYHTQGEKEQGNWIPADPALSSRAILYQLAPGKVTVLENDKLPVSADRVRIWAESETGLTWLSYRGEDLWLVKKNQAGERTYQAAEMETYTYNVELPRDEVTLHERLLQARNDTRLVLLVEGQALARNLHGEPVWRSSAITKILPGQTLTLRQPDGWLLRGSQARLWAQDEGEQFRWWNYREKALEQVPEKGYQARELGASLFVFQPSGEKKGEKDGKEARADDGPPTLLLRPDQVKVPQVTGLSVKAAGTELERSGLKGIFEDVKIAPDDLVTAQEPAAGWSLLVAEVLLTVQTTVPNVVGLRLADARAVLDEVGLAVAANAADAQGQVVSQEPAADSLAKKGTRVTVVLGEADARIKVPALVGRTFTEAKEDLEAVGLVIAADGDNREGQVESQEPAADTAALKGSKVMVVLRQGQDQVRVPDLAGRTYEEARDDLKAAGLVIAGGGDEPKGQVASQEPAADSLVKKDSKVTVVLQEVPPQIGVPDVVGKTFDEARDILEAAGLGIDTGDAPPKGRVESQAPEVDTQVAKGSKVAVILRAPAEESVRVPNVTALSYDDAVEALQAVGLALSTATASTNGRVMSQAPAAGEEVPPGTKVIVRFPGAAEPPPEEPPPQEPPTDQPAQPPEPLLPPDLPLPPDDPTLPVEPDVEVPDVVGMNLVRARLRILSVGLNFAFQGNPAAGFAIGQDPVGGTRVPRGSLVTVGFAGADQVRVPNVIARTPADAQALVIAAGLVFQPLGDLNGGVARAQLPAAGLLVLRGSAVIVTFPDRVRVRVPDVVGRSLVQARARVQAAGLVLRVQGDPRGTLVRLQLPDAGTEVFRGSTVQVVLGRPEDIAVPDIRGLNLNAARVRVEGAGLVLRTQGDPQLGPVVRQTPDPFTLVVRGATVTGVFDRPGRVRVPDVGGTGAARARQILEAAGLVFRPQGDPRQGTARSQTPVPGTMVARGSPVRVVFGDAQQVRVPNVVNLDWGRARARLEAVGLVARTQGDAREGAVRRQSPVAGTRVDRGSTVTLELDRSLLVRIPDVVGATLGQSRQRLSGAGLVLQAQGDIGGGSARSESPPAGTRTRRGTMVVVVFGRTNLVRVPDVVGSREAKARAALQSNGLRLQVEGDPQHGPARRQRPQAGTEVARGSSVTVDFPVAPSRVRVPDLANLRYDSARARLEADGLVAQVSGTGRQGVVRTQSPAAGSMIAKGSTVTLTLESKAPGVRVPSVVGLSFSSAKAKIEAAGLAVKALGDASKGTVQSQNPTSGSMIAKGSLVTVVFPAALTRVRVPSVFGLTYLKARSQLEAAGLVIQVQGTSRQGTVRSQNPLAGSMVAKGSAVTVTFPTAPAGISVPSVVGLTFARAKAKIEAAGLSVQVQGNSQGGTVRSQSPAAGTMAAKGSHVTVVFPTAPAQVRVPNIVGQTLANARAQLEAAGLVLRTRGDTRKGNVRSQTPAAGAMVARGSSVTAVFPTAAAPTEIAVPNIVGLNYQNALDRLRKAGLRMATTGDTRKGPARSQVPAAGAQVKQGGVVTVAFP